MSYRKMSLNSLEAAERERLYHRGQRTSRPPPFILE